MGENEGNDRIVPADLKKKSSLFSVLLVVGALGGVCVVGSAVALPALFRAKLHADESRCVTNLKQIALAAMQYADDNRSFPFDASDPTGRKALEALVPKYLDNPDLLGCPCRGTEGVAYEGFVARRASNAPGSVPIVWDGRPHVDGSRYVAFADAHVEAMKSEAEFLRVLEVARRPASGK